MIVTIQYSHSHTWEFSCNALSRREQLAEGNCSAGSTDLLVNE